MCSTCAKFEERQAAGSLVVPHGAVAQLVERFHGMEEAARSIRVGSTSDHAFMLAGFVAGEGSFGITQRQPPFQDGAARLRFQFDVTVATRDRPMLEQLRTFLGFGSITDRRPRMPRWQPTSQLRVASIKAHLAATILWANEHLLVSHKREQYERWRHALLRYEIEHPRRMDRSRCSEPGCDDFVRGRGLCRRHYYRATGY